MVVDWITSGRHAVGERWAFARYNSRIQVTREGKLILYDGITLQQGTDPLVEPMGRFDVFATCVITGPLAERAAAAIVTSVEQLPIEHRAETIESAYALEAGGAVLRIAGTSVERTSAGSSVYTLTFCPRFAARTRGCANGDFMHLTPQETDKLALHQAGYLAQKRRGDGPFLFTQVINGVGVDSVVSHVTSAWQRAISS